MENLPLSEHKGKRNFSGCELVQDTKRFLLTCSRRLRPPDLGDRCGTRAVQSPFVWGKQPRASQPLDGGD